MAGLSTAWRLSERKGVSSRGQHGRIEQELDRATTDPAAPILTWDQALTLSDNLGMADQWGKDWLVWPVDTEPATKPQTAPTTFKRTCPRW
jgi:hypothetical protein